MTILDDLKNNKGTLSSELSKKLAVEAINGNLKILDEAIELATYFYKNKKEKNVRSGAGKIVECVAEKRPDLVAPKLDDLLLALEVDEPQTRWCIIRTFGFCAQLNKVGSKKGIPFARQYIRDKKEGQLCLVSSADIFLGDYGQHTRENKNDVFDILIESSGNVIKNEHNWILESIIKLLKHLDVNEKKIVLDIAKEFKGTIENKTSKLCSKIIQICR
jgi:hypothetical protein